MLQSQRYVMQMWKPGMTEKSSSMVLMQVEVITLLMQKQLEDLPEVWLEPYSGKKIIRKQEFLHRESVPLLPGNMPEAFLD